LVLSPDVLAEYERVAGELAEKYDGADADAMLALIVSKSAMMDAPPLSRQICDDLDDDKFIACAVAGGAIAIVSGDKLLLKVSAYQGVRVMTARQFVEEFLR
jgi:predicted nucleic acid-binding protein